MKKLLLLLLLPMITWGQTVKDTVYLTSKDTFYKVIEKQVEIRNINEDKIDWTRILELFLSGVGVLLFFGIQKFYENYVKRKELKANEIKSQEDRIAKSKETRLKLFESKKIEAVLHFISSYNELASKLAKGLPLIMNVNTDKK